MSDELFEDFFQVFNFCDINSFGEKLEKPLKVLVYRGTLKEVNKWVEFKKKVCTVKYQIEEYNYNEWHYPEDNNCVISNLWLNRIKKGVN